MKKGKRVHVFLGAALLLLAGQCLGGNALLAGERGLFPQMEETGEIDTVAETAVEKEEVVETDAVVKRDVYPIGSVSKTFAAAAVLKLSEQGKIDLDRPVTDYLPEFRLKDARYKEITVKMLLSHSSGIMGTVAGGQFVLGENDSVFHDTYLDKLANQTLKADPGEYSVYCNSGFMVTELLVERVTGMDYSEYLLKEIATPLGLNSTGSVKIGPDKERYVRTKVNGRETPFVNCQEIADGGMLSTTDDLCRFGQIFMEDNDFLSAQSKKLMMDNYSAKDRFGYVEGDSMFRYGLGLDGVGIYPYNQYGLFAVAKGGNVGRFQTSLTVLPEQKLIVAITGQGGQSEECELMAQDIVLSVLREEGLIDDTELTMEEEKSRLYGTGSTECIPVPEEIKAYAGNYGSTGLYEISFEQEGRMHIKTISGEQTQGIDFNYLGDGTFAASEDDFIGFMGDFASDSGRRKGCSLVWFEKVENGNIYLMGKNYEEKTGVGKEAVSGAVAQKLPECRADEKSQKAWKDREDTWYFLVNEPYNSMGYLSNPIGKLHVNEGYVTMNTISGNYERNAAVILDAARCDSNLDVPLMTSRDLVNYEAFEKDGVEYLTGEGDSMNTFCSEKGLLSSAQLSGTYQFKGETPATWFKIEPGDEGKTAVFTASEKAGYFVYDKNGECVFSSLYQNAGNKVVLPKKGYIALVGEKGESVTVTD